MLFSFSAVGIANVISEFCSSLFTSSARYEGWDDFICFELSKSIDFYVSLLSFVGTPKIAMSTFDLVDS